MDSLIKEVLKIGLIPTFLLIILFLIIQDPERITKLKAIITQPFFRIWKWFSKEHISSKVSSQVNEFFKRNLYSLLTNNERYYFKVKWVSEAKDPILQENGSIILRLKEDSDQTKNIFSAVQVALPHTICPFIRNNISQTCVKSIDLTILQKLAYKLGRHGKAIFKRYFLDPEIEEDKEIGELLKELFKLDKYGFFAPIFLNELELVGEGIYAENDINDYTLETLDFIKYLLSIVDRERGSEIELNYFKTPFNLGTILLAKAQRADTQGLRPYLKRLRIKLDKGAESIYIIAYPPAFSFFDKFLKALDGHERVFVKNVFNTSEYVSANHITKLKIALLRKNDIYVDETFQSRIEANNIIIGHKVTGIVEHISKNECLVNVLGMRAYINRKDCSWLSITDCNEVLEIDKEYDFQVKNIDKTTSTIHLTMKFDSDNPWINDELPKLDEEILVKVKAYDTIKYTCILNPRIEVYIPISEMSWYILSKNSMDKFIGKTIKAKVININEDEEKIFCSRKQLEKNPWPTIHKSLPKGTMLTGKVIDVTPYFVDVELPNGYKGRIPKEALDKAGYEYKNFEENIVVGQGIEVVVTKVFIAKHKIRLDLKRNMDNAP